MAVQVSVNDFPGDYDANYSDYTKLVKGLVYDRASNEIRYGDTTVCAKVREHQFLITRWHSIHETGSCALEERQKEVIVDNGFDNPYSYWVTEIYLTVAAKRVVLGSTVHSRNREKIGLGARRARDCVNSCMDIQWHAQ